MSVCHRRSFFLGPTSLLRAFSDEALADVDETVVNYLLDKINMATNEGESSLRGEPNTGVDDSCTTGEHLMTPGTVSDISGFSVEDVRRAYSSRIREMERDMKEVKDQLQSSIMMSCDNKTERAIKVGGQHPQYDGMDAVSYNRVMSYVSNVLSHHIKFQERGWNEYDNRKDSVCDKIMMRTRVRVP